MATQQDIFVAGFENRPPMISKDDYVQWSSRIICYCRSKPNGKLLAKFILEGPQNYGQILEPSDDILTLLVPDTYKLQIENEHIATIQKQVEANDQAIHISLLGLPVDVYAVVDSF
ncbi:hypothetical protein Tco_1280457 [Tanacetum coccineum]